jgi:hypothetical protein
VKDTFFDCEDKPPVGRTEYEEPTRMRVSDMSRLWTPEPAPEAPRPGTLADFRARSDTPEIAHPLEHCCIPESMGLTVEDCLTEKSMQAAIERQSIAQRRRFDAEVERQRRNLETFLTTILPERHGVEAFAEATHVCPEAPPQPLNQLAGRLEKSEFELEDRELAPLLAQAADGGAVRARQTGGSRTKAGDDPGDGEPPLSLRELAKHRVTPRAYQARVRARAGLDWQVVRDAIAAWKRARAVSEVSR